MIIDGTDNADYFIYKFNLSKKDQKRLKSIDFFYKKNVNIKNFTEKNFNKIFYYNGKQAVLDIINFKLFTSIKFEKKLLKLVETYKDKIIPTLPIGASTLMTKYNIPEGKILGNKLKLIEETWVQNSFQISEKQIQKIIKS
jgi:poly(A) polymerase